MSEKFRYAVKENCSNFQFDSYEIECYKGMDLKILAEKCAEDYFNNHDGYEYSGWPLIFILWDSNGNKLGIFDVDLVIEPRFYASKITEKE